MTQAEIAEAKEMICQLQAAGCCACLTSVAAMAKERGIGGEALVQALTELRQERLEAEGMAVAR